MTRPPPCTLVIFGASGDLTKRLLLPSLYHLAEDGLLPEHFAILGVSRETWTDTEFRDQMGAAIRTWSARKDKIDAVKLEALLARLDHVRGSFDDPGTYDRVAVHLLDLEASRGTTGNALFYLATPPTWFATVSRGIKQRGLNESTTGWRRVIVEKPFGHDLPSAIALGKEILSSWREEQVWRIDHYLGKETVQNLLAFRFANGIFEPLWNRHHIDHIQFTAAESVGVEGRGAYYDHVGVLRDMVQNHMFQMLAYLCMEPPTTFAADDIRDEKARLLRAVRIPTADDVATDAVRGQYAAGRGPSGGPAVGYREEPSVDPASNTETFCALNVHIDNWRWEGVPIYLRSGKRLWKKGTEIVVQFRRPPQVMVKGPAAAHIEPNRLIFHVQPDQGIEVRIQAKVPGSGMELQEVKLRFAWSDAFRAARATGYEALLHQAMLGDATLFSRSDLVESAWRIVQPVLDVWEREPPTDFPNYEAGTWGPHRAYDLLRRDGRRWLEVPNHEVLDRVPIFRGADPTLVASLALLLLPAVADADQYVIHHGDIGDSMYILCRGEAVAVNEAGDEVARFRDGDVFGEIALLFPVPRTASVRAVTDCDLLQLNRVDFERILAENPEMAEKLITTARARYPGV